MKGRPFLRRTGKRASLLFLLKIALRCLERKSLREKRCKYDSIGYVELFHAVQAVLGVFRLDEFGMTIGKADVVAIGVAGAGIVRAVQIAYIDRLIPVLARRDI
jgi:hypothetical protein